MSSELSPLYDGGKWLIYEHTEQWLCQCDLQGEGRAMFVQIIISSHLHTCTGALISSHRGTSGLEDSVFLMKHTKGKEGSTAPITDSFQFSLLAPRPPGHLSSCWRVKNPRRPLITEKLRGGRGFMVTFLPLCKLGQ